MTNPQTFTAQRPRESFSLTSYGLPVKAIEYTYSDHFAIRAWVAGVGGRVVHEVFPFAGDDTPFGSERLGRAVDAAVKAARPSPELLAAQVDAYRLTGMVTAVDVPLRGIVLTTAAGEIVATDLADAGHRLGILARHYSGWGIQARTAKAGA